MISNNFQITGTRNDSHIEYSKLPGRQLDGFDLTITFRTFDVHGGLIFYAAAERAPSQFLAVYMKDAKVGSLKIIYQTS